MKIIHDTRINKFIYSLINFCLFLLIASSAYAQQQDYTGFAEIGIASPTATALAEYGSVPVSMATGIPSISIPITTVSAGQLSVPISLNYHAGGIKVTEYPSEVGLGWSLSSGGVITRVVNGYQDELDEGNWNGYFTKADLINNPLDPYWSDLDNYHEFLREIAKNTIDAEPDVYYYNFGGYSGFFVIDGQGEFVSFPDANIGIQYTITFAGIENTKSIDDFTITTEDGTRYYFSQRELSKKEFTNDTEPGGQFPNTEPYPHGILHPTAWYVTEITHPSQKASIKFEYELKDNTSSSTVSIGSSVLTNYLKGSGTDPACTTDSWSINTSTSQSRVDSLVQLTKVYVDGGTGREVTYFYETDVLNLPIKYRLNYLYVRNQNSEIERIFDLNYTRDTGVGQLLLLDEVIEKNNTWTPSPPYKFEYNLGIQVGRESVDRDFLGYPRSDRGTNVNHLFGNVIPTDDDIGIGETREPEINYTEDGVLRKITFPTGGFTSFEYELNTAFVKDTVREIGGLRIKKITSNALDPDSDPVVKEYVYGEGNVVGLELFIERGGNFTKRVYQIFDGEECELETAVAAPETPLFGHYVSYDYVSEIIEGGEGGARTEVYDTKVGGTNLSNYFGGGSEGVTYSRAMPLFEQLQIKADSINLDMNTQEYLTVHETETEFGVYSGINVGGYFSDKTSFKWQRPDIYFIETRTSGVQGAVVRVDTLYPTKSGSYKRMWAYPIKKTNKRLYHEWVDNPTVEVIDLTNDGYWMYPEDAPPYYEDPTSDYLLVYFDSSYYKVDIDKSVITSTVEYEYDQISKQLTKQTSTNSSGDKVITEYEYAHKQNGLTSMVDSVDFQPMLLTTVYSTTTKNVSNEVLRKQWTTFSNLSITGLPDRWLPQERWIWEGGSMTDVTAPALPSSEAIRTVKINQYDDQNNPLEIEDIEGNTLSYVWSNDNEQILGKFKNAASDEVYVHSFAYDELTNWIVYDRYGDGDFQASATNNVLKLRHLASTASSERDYIGYNIGSEITESLIWEFDVQIANSNNWDLQMNAGGSSWNYNGASSSLETAVWTAINNEQWRVYNGSTWITIATGLEIGKTYSFKIVMHPSSNKADYYLSGELKQKDVSFRFPASGIQKFTFGSYGYGTTTTEWFIDNVRIYPADAIAQTQEINPRNQTTAIKGEDGATVRFTYDTFDRLNETINQNGNLVSSNSYHYSLDSNSSYTATDPNRVESITYFDPSSSSDNLKSVSYLDGLGRPVQSQVQGSSNTIIQATNYDFGGRPKVSLKPIEISGQSTLVTNMFNGTNDFGSSALVLADGSPVESYYDGLVGNQDAQYAYSYTQYEDYPLFRVIKATIPGDTLRWRPDDSGTETKFEYGLNETETFTINGKIWGTYSLSKTVTKDPSGKITISYIDGWGNTIATGIDMNGDKLLLDSLGSPDLITKFEYDVKGNLIRSVDPRGLSTTYSYNQLGQLIEKKLPDQTHPNKYRYDDKGRLRFHRDPNLDAASDHYYYTRYDDFDRPIEIGIVHSSSGFDSQANTASFPSTNNTKYVTNQYDNAHSAYPYANNLKGKLVYTEYLDSNSGQKGETWYSYNNQGLVEWIIQRVPTTTSEKKIEYEYDELGRLIKVKYNMQSSSEAHVFWYEYDEFGRLEVVKSYADDSYSSALTEATYEYYADGQVKTIILGDGAQTIDYEYTIQGWLDEINNGTTSSGDVFGLNLGYNYNGTISSQAWRQAGAGDTSPMTFNYSYDNANRLSSAMFNGSGYNSNAFDVTYGYDKVGNVLSIDRYNQSGSKNNAHGEIDITYGSNSNRISLVYQNGDDYNPAYDANGNIKTYEVQGITNSTFNWLNLPTSMTANGTSLSYAYDPSGMRVKKTVGSTTTYYIRGADGQTIATYDGSGNLLFWNIVAGGQIIGQIDN